MTTRDSDSLSSSERDRLIAERDDARIWHDRMLKRAQTAEAELFDLRQAHARLLQALTEIKVALLPFAVFAEKWDAKPLKGIADEFYAIHAGEDGASLTLSDCRRARAALAVVRVPQRQEKTEKEKDLTRGEQTGS